MKTKNKALLIWALMLVVATSSSFYITEAFEDVRNVDIFKLFVVGFLAGGFFNELVKVIRKN